MGGETEGRINKMAEGVMKLTDSDITQKASNITYQSSNITRMNWPDGRYTIGVNIGAGAEIAGTVHKVSEGSD